MMTITKNQKKTQESGHLDKFGGGSDQESVCLKKTEQA